MTDQEILMKAKKQIETARSSADETTGRLKMLSEQLKKDFGCEDLTEAQRKLDKMDKDLDKAEQQHKRQITAFEKKFPWN